MTENKRPNLYDEVLNKHISVVNRKENYISILASDLESLSVEDQRMLYKFISNLPDPKFIDVSNMEEVTGMRCHNGIQMPMILSRIEKLSKSLEKDSFQAGLHSYLEEKIIESGGSLRFE